jgi:hypothetical protein
MRGARPLLIVLLLAFLTGCPPQRLAPRPQSRQEALQRVNSNLERVDQPLQCAAEVSFKFRDEDGRLHSVVGRDARLFFAAPRSLRFDVRSLTGTVARFGSNEERYWFWVDLPEEHKLWWGRWACVNALSESHLPVPPNQLLDALMLRPLPETLEGGLRPLLRFYMNDQRLLFVRLGGDGQPIGWREVQLDPYPPYQPLEVVDRLADGEVVMRAELGDYERVGVGGPFTPRTYVLVWPESVTEMRAEMRILIRDAKFRPDLSPSDFDQFPQWQYEIEEIDQGPPCEPGP